MMIFTAFFIIVLFVFSLIGTIGSNLISLSVYAVYGLRFQNAAVVDWAVHAAEFFVVVLNVYFVLFEKPKHTHAINAIALSGLFFHRILALYIHELNDCGCGFNMFGLSDHLVTAIVAVFIGMNAYFGFLNKYFGTTISN